MVWNWQLPNWPKFHYDPNRISEQEKQFLLNSGKMSAHLKNIDSNEHKKFIIEILGEEGSGSSKIEGEILDRESLQSSIARHFGLKVDAKKGAKKESGMAELLCDVYESFQSPLQHQTLWKWHSMLFPDDSKIEYKGSYRAHAEPMQIISSRYDQPTIFFEAPPSNTVFDEMAAFISWFNSINNSEPVLGKVAVAHVYFESIHPFEDGNGRIGRALVEKMLSSSVGNPSLIAVSKVLEKRRKEYYVALESCNRSLNANHWIDFFADAVLQAQKDSMELLLFLIKKCKILTLFSQKINPRQEKALLRIFEEGPSGFKGGLSAENYISITKASRATATRDLANLVEMGILIKTGELRHTRYQLNPEISVK